MLTKSAVFEDCLKEFSLEIKGKLVPIPYRINVPAVEHPRKQGKSSPKELLDQLILEAKEQNFNLAEASVEKIQDFMRHNQLGLDCSGFVYRMIDLYLEKEGMGSMIEHGFEHVGRTNAAKLTSDDFSAPINNQDAQSGDIIRLNSGEDVLHCMLVLNREDTTINYVHVSSQTKPAVVHKSSAKILDNNLEFNENLGDISYNPDKGDGLRRLKLFL